LAIGFYVAILVCQIFEAGKRLDKKKKEKLETQLLRLTFAQVASAMFSK